jgi:CubicO group peptidase (beta-lactamase class C family)
MTARDAGRFGLLILAGGAWRGQTIVPAEWVKAATSRSVESANPAYGYLWWLNGGEYYYLPLNSRKHDAALWPNCPQDAFAALGKDDQKIFVVPSKGIVAIRFGDAAYSSTLGNSQFDDQFLSLICDAVKKRD